MKWRFRHLLYITKNNWIRKSKFQYLKCIKNDQKWHKMTKFPKNILIFVWKLLFYLKIFQFKSGRIDVDELSSFNIKINQKTKRKYWIFKEILSMTSWWHYFSCILSPPTQFAHVISHISGFAYVYALKWPECSI